jgi:hypothetical protein
MEKNDIITLILVILNIIVLYKILNKILYKNESYDTGYNQYTTFRDEARKFKL